MSSEPIYVLFFTDDIHVEVLGVFRSQELADLYARRLGPQAVIQSCVIDDARWFGSGPSWYGAVLNREETLAPTSVRFLGALEPLNPNVLRRYVLTTSSGQVIDYITYCLQADDYDQALRLAAEKRAALLPIWDTIEPQFPLRVGSQQDRS